MNSNLDTYISDGTPERVRERYRRLSDLAKKADFGALDENIVAVSYTHLCRMFHVKHLYLIEVQERGP